MLPCHINITLPGGCVVRSIRMFFPSILKNKQLVAKDNLKFNIAQLGSSFNDYFNIDSSEGVTDIECVSINDDYLVVSYEFLT